ncbi:MAG: hypothetical protein B6D45_09350 [Ignavibacteriales bacterium UTCHB3]|nr:MAG: hypothetical protein B6D45_09350 [Ignavibacteriales bacterium UTCHB3]
MMILFIGKVSAKRTNAGNTSLIKNCGYEQHFALNNIFWIKNCSRTEIFSCLPSRKKDSSSTTNLQSIIIINKLT